MNAQNKQNEREHLDRVVASNRKARHDYTIVDVVEAGIVLLGSEVKSVRSGQVQLADAYAHVVNGEMWLDGIHISSYAFAHGVGAHEPMRRRKLLLHREQIRRMQDRINKERLTIVPLRSALQQRSREGGHCTGQGSDRKPIDVKPLPKRNLNLKCAARPVAKRNKAITPE
jgi:SsrA-binding protein